MRGTQHIYRLYAVQSILSRRSTRYGKRAKSSVLRNLIQYGKNGIPNKELSIKSDVDRNIVSTICNDSKSEGLVRIVKNGIRMTYFPTEKLLKNISVRPWVFGDYVFSNLAIDMMNVRSSPFYQTKLNRVGDRREKLFFDFSVRMGAMITYVLMQAMNSNTIKQLTLGETVDKDTEYFVEEWIKMVVNPLKMLRQLHGYYWSK